MLHFFAKYFSFFFLISIFSCTSKNIKPANRSNKSTVSIFLPFEASNIAPDTNFILFDSLGKKCIATYDTVTKSGGHIQYNGLPNGIYTWWIKTVFNEEISKQITVNRDTSFVFYDDCYDIVTVIELDSLKAAKKINLIVETEEGGIALEAEKNENSYSVRYNLNNEWSTLHMIDSTKFINALFEFGVRTTGLSAMNVRDEEDPTFYASTNVYLKCNNQLTETWNIKNSYLTEAVEKLTRTLADKK